MSYDIDFRVKVEGIDRYISVHDCGANITWNVRKIIELSTGLPWLNEANNGLCKDIIPHIEQGLAELKKNPEKYKQYEEDSEEKIDFIREYCRRYPDNHWYALLCVALSNHILQHPGKRLVPFTRQRGNMGLMLSISAANAGQRAHDQITLIEHVQRRLSSCAQLLQKALGHLKLMGALGVGGVQQE